MDTPTTTADRVYQSIRELIVSGQLEPGTRLIQRQLAARFGTSNIPIVEAIRRLEGDSLVVSHPNWGALVKVWTKDDIEGVYLVREALEGIACRLFAERASTVDKFMLVEYGKAFDEAARDVDEKRCDEADVALHLHIVQCTKSPMLVSLAENSSVIAATIKNTFNNLLADTQRVGPIGIHDALIEALISGDSQAAEQKGKEHIRDAFARQQLLAVAQP